MELSQLRKAIAAVALAALAACSGNGAGTGSAPVLPAHDARPAQQGILARIVGVGDSLTAGYQSDGFLGQTGLANPLNPGVQVPPNQENGWWALLDEQASNSTIADAINQMYDPAKSPLPLIKGPGLDNQIVPAGPSAFFPFGQFKGTDPCTFAHGFNQAGFLLQGSARVRTDPSSPNIRDLGVPGSTLHEANVLHQPQTSTCSPLPGIPGLLSDVVTEESGTFWPVLRTFTKLDGHLTEVNAAASLHPTLATVWLGANDVLKYMGSGGRFVGGDRTAGQAQNDLRAAISTLQRAGARVVVANLPNILETGYFQRVTHPKSPHDCKLRSYAYCLLQLDGLETFVPSIARKYHLDTPNGCSATSLTTPCGYLTLPGTIEFIQYYNLTGEPPNLDCATPSPTCKPVKGSGLGSNYITPEFAAKVQALNNAVNQGIDDAVSSSHVPLVDIHAIFHGLASGTPSNPYFAQAAAINPPKCCALGYLYGILSFDGIHPSNTGYALVAYSFIEAINKAYGAHIPEVDVRAVYDGSRCKNPKFCYPDPYAPPNDIP
ncbi:MAG TPA: hypothetical protein VIX60_08585 [Candidatus Cybelea sp.]